MIELTGKFTGRNDARGSLNLDGSKIAQPNSQSFVAKFDQQQRLAPAVQLVKNGKASATGGTLLNDTSCKEYNKAPVKRV